MIQSEAIWQASTSGKGLFFLCGPCVIESPELCLEVGRFLADIAGELGVTLVFKASFDKANRTSIDSFRGPGLKAGLEVLAKVKAETGLPVVSDIHTPAQAELVAQVADVIQIPAFLCRQTDLLLAAGETGRIINIKKGQFMAPLDMASALGKVRSTGNKKIWLTERGASFGYNNLVVDMRSIPLMKSLGCPVVMDATHSVQLPGGLGNKSGGDREHAPVLAAAAVAAGADGVFMEAHPRPDQALCDGPNSLPLSQTPKLLKRLLAIARAAREDE